MLKRNLQLVMLADEKLVEEIRTNNQELFGEIVKRYEQQLLRYAIYLLADYHLASDAVQNAFIKAFVNLNSFNIDKKFSSWLFRIAHNEAMNLIRKKPDSKITAETLVVADKVDIEADLILSENKEELYRCLSMLDAEARSALILYYFEDKKYEEISDILHVPINTIGTWISRAKKQMRKICQKKITR